MVVPVGLHSALQTMAPHPGCRRYVHSAQRQVLCNTKHSCTSSCYYFIHTSSLTSPAATAAHLTSLSAQQYLTNIHTPQHPHRKHASLCGYTTHVPSWTVQNPMILYITPPPPPVRALTPPTLASAHCAVPEQTEQPTCHRTSSTGAATFMGGFTRQVAPAHPALRHHCHTTMPPHCTAAQGIKQHCSITTGAHITHAALLPRNCSTLSPATARSQQQL
jgi:hypothetical protein